MKRDQKICLSSFLFPLLLLLFSNVCFAQDIRVRFLDDRGAHQPRARFDELRPALIGHGIAMAYTEDIGELTLENLRRHDVLVVYANIDAIVRKPAKAILGFGRQRRGLCPPALRIALLSKPA